MAVLLHVTSPTDERPNGAADTSSSSDHSDQTPTAGAVPQVMVVVVKALSFFTTSSEVEGVA